MTKEEKEMLTMIYENILKELQEIKNQKVSNPSITVDEIAKELLSPDSRIAMQIKQILKSLNIIDSDIIQFEKILTSIINDRNYLNERLDLIANQIPKHSTLSYDFKNRCFLYALAAVLMILFTSLAVNIAQHNKIKTQEAFIKKVDNIFE